MILKLLKVCSVIPHKLYGLPSAGSCKVSCLHSLSVGLKPMVSLSLAVLPEQEGHLILAIGGLDHKVHIYCGDQSGKVCKSCQYFSATFACVSCANYHFMMCSSLKPVNLRAILTGLEV